MKNPCQNCIIKSNCTWICEDKIKYRKSLELELKIAKVSKSYEEIRQCQIHLEKNLQDLRQILNRRIKIIIKSKGMKYAKK